MKKEITILKCQMIRITCLCAVLAVICFGLYRYSNIGIFFSLMVTAVTVFYHLAMRLFVGWYIDSCLEDKLKGKSFWFREKKFEKRLYEKWKVKLWKEKMPSYVPEKFSPKKHSLDEIIRAMCAAEIIHEVNFILSYVPLVFSFLIPGLQGDVTVFGVTSVLASLVELPFVIMQRYNRPRFVRIREKER